MSSRHNNPVSYRKNRLDYLYQVSTILKIPIPQLITIPIPVIQDLIEIYEKYHKDDEDLELED